jgi:Protein of unknown function (DUF3309)
MGFGIVLLIVVTLLLMAAMPTWPHSRQWGYAPSGVLGVVAAVVLVQVWLRHF